MKQYPKSYENLYEVENNRNVYLDLAGSVYGSLDDLAEQFRSFYRDAHRSIFDVVVRQIWLEQQFTFNKARRKRRSANGFKQEATFSYFMKSVVGISQKPITNNRCFTAIASYLKELFPDFLYHNPFEEPEFFKYPFSHVTLDHMFFVANCEDRLDMLRYAEEKEMSFVDFANWAVNHVLSYNEEVGREVYSVASAIYGWTYIKNNELPPERWEELFDFHYVD
jgi:hypothetical protein